MLSNDAKLDHAAPPQTQAAHRVTWILGFHEPVAFVPCRGGRRYLVLAESLDLFELDDFDATLPQLVGTVDAIGHQLERAAPVPPI